MSEEKDKEGKEKTNANPDEGDKPETIEVIKRQSQRIKELEDANLKREEEEAKKQLGGDTFAGQKKEDKKETDEDLINLSNDVLKGKFNK